VKNKCINSVLTHGLFWSHHSSTASWDDRVQANSLNTESVVWGYKEKERLINSFTYTFT